MVINDVTDVPGCDAEEVNKITVFADDGFGVTRYFDSSNIAPTTAAGPGCTHDVSGSGVDLGVSCAGATRVVVNAAGGGDKVGYYDYKQATGIPIVIHGGAGKDHLSTTPGHNRVFGEGGNDYVNGGGVLSGGAGRDTVQGDNLADSLFGGQGNDRVAGAGGPDKVYGGAGRDLLLGGSGRDAIFAHDRRRDQRIDCGPDPDAAPVIDVGVDPSPRSC